MVRYFLSGVVLGLNIVNFAIVMAQAPSEPPRSVPVMGDDPREVRLIEGMDQGIKENYRGAIAIFTELIQRYPDYAVAYFNRGIARAKLMDFQGAIADQTQAIVYQADLAEAYQARGQVYWQLGQKSLAIADLQKALQLYQQQDNPISEQEIQQRLERWQHSPN